jgi:hypothetical protein
MIGAADLTIKADTCFKETARVLKPFMSTVPDEVLADLKKVEDMGLLQASKIYALMFGPKRGGSGVSSIYPSLFYDRIPLIKYQGP